jgi:hypothetical protein
MMKLFAFLLACIIAAPAQSQVLDTLWTHAYGHDYYDTTGWVSETADHGFIITHGTLLPDRNNYDFCLVRTDSLGNTIWSKTIINNLSQLGNHVIETSDGGFFATGGTTADSSAFSSRAWFVKTNSQGDTVWTRTYGTSNAFGYYGIQTSDYGFAATGFVSAPGRSADAFLAKYDSDGDIEWAYNYGNSRYQLGSFLAQTPDSGYVIGGYSNGASTSSDFWVFRTNKYGTVLWDSTYGPGSNSDMIYGGCATGDGGFIFTGKTVTTSFIAYILRIDSLGHTVWSHYVQPTSEGHLVTAAPTSDGGFILGGTQIIPSYGRDYWLMKINGDGDSLWSFTHGVSDEDHARCAAQTSDGSFIILGNTHIGGIVRPYLIKVGYRNDGIRDDLPSRPDQISLYQNYPNPFNPATVILYSIPSRTCVTLKVYDIMGREMATLVDEEKESGNYQTIFDASKLSGGVYFYKLRAGSISITKKAILLK